MSYEYKDHQIFARVHQTGSALYEIDKNGNITEEVEGCDIVHDDQTIVWYEVEAIDVDAKPFPMTTIFCELKTLEEAKAVVDKSRVYTKTLV